MLYFCISFIFFLFQFATITSVEVTTIATEIANTNNTEVSTISSEAPPLPASAEKFVRQRRQPSIKIIRHIVRSSKRAKPYRRIKQPKTKYGPPHYISSKPITYYKSQHYTYPIGTSPLTIDNIENVNLNHDNYGISPTSYEGQSMDLDFYSNNDNTYEIPSKNFNIEYEFSTETVPLISYQTPSSPIIKDTLRTPHEKYGVPKEYEYFDDFNVHDVSTYVANSNSNSHNPEYDLSYATHDNSYPKIPDKIYDEISPSRPTSIQKPSQNYEISADYIPETHFPITNIEENDSSYQKNSPHSVQSFNYLDRHNFAEPPSSVSNIEISYSPPNEIKLPSESNDHINKPYDNSDAYNKHPGHFAEPPTHPPVEYNKPIYNNTAKITQLPPLQYDEYFQPSQELPLNPNHKPPTYGYNKSSYEVPIYDPIPFEASNNEEHELYPPNSFDAISNHDADAEDLHMLPNSKINENTNNNNNIKKIFSSFHHNSTGIKNDTYSANTSDFSSTAAEASERPRRIRRKKRVRGTTTSTTKHILDVPELKAAFEAGQRYRYKHNSNTDADVDESEKVEATHNYHSYNNMWNPMRIHISSRALPTSTTTPATVKKEQFKNNPRKPNQFTSKTRYVTPSTVTTETTKILQRTHKNATGLPNNTRTSEKIAIVSIQKSRSKSYYDGTLPPPTLTISNTYKSRHNVSRTPTRSASTLNPDRRATSSKRTTKSIFDTTHFKSPRYNIDPKLSTIGENLPKNHKLY